MASKVAGDEGQEVWFNASLTSCEELTNEGPASVIIRNFASA
jgi:hypothetical protein